MNLSIVIYSKRILKFCGCLFHSAKTKGPDKTNYFLFEVPFMDRDAFIGNITTIGKFILLATGTPSLVSLANSSDFAILIGAIFGVIWAFYDSKYFNTFFNHKNETEPSSVLNDEYLYDEEVFEDAD